MSTIFRNIYFSLCFNFYSTKKIQIGKGEMRVKNQESALFPSQPHYLQSLWVCLQRHQLFLNGTHIRTCCIFYHPYSKLACGMKWVGGTKVCFLLISYVLCHIFNQESKLDQLQIQTSDFGHQSHWSLHQWQELDQFSVYWFQSQSFRILFWTVESSRN